MENLEDGQELDPSRPEGRRNRGRESATHKVPLQTDERVPLADKEIEDYVARDSGTPYLLTPGESLWEDFGHSVTTDSHDPRPSVPTRRIDTCRRGPFRNPSSTVDLRKERKEKEKEKRKKERTSQDRHLETRPPSPSPDPLVPTTHPDTRDTVERKREIGFRITRPETRDQSRPQRRNTVKHVTTKPDHSNLLHPRRTPTKTSGLGYHQCRGSLHIKE